MMLHVLLLVGAMALSAEAGEKERPLNFFVTIQNPFRYDAMDKFRCCWGAYRLKMIMTQGDSDWVTIKSRSDVYVDRHMYQRVHADMYTVGMSDVEWGSDNMPNLVGFVLKYEREQGERMVTNHMLYGFWGITQMGVSWRLDYVDQRPVCKFATNQTYGSNAKVAVCLYNRNDTDAQLRKKVMEEFPDATYFTSVKSYRLPGNGLGGMGGMGVAGGESGMEAEMMSASGMEGDNAGMNEGGDMIHEEPGGEVVAALMSGGGGLYESGGSGVGAAMSGPGGFNPRGGGTHMSSNKEEWVRAICRERCGRGCICNDLCVCLWP